MNTKGNLLRPKRLSEIIGQRDIVEIVGVSIKASKIRNKAVGHILLDGMPGLGKTTIAQIISEEMGSEIKYISAPAMKKPKDLVGILLSMSFKDVLFIDEMHRLDKSIQEYLYSAMEDFVIDIVDGEGDSSNAVRLPLQEFTVVGATTHLSLIDSPLRMRFMNVLELKPYSKSESIDIIRKNIKKLGVNLLNCAEELIASVSRGTPRIINNILKNTLDWQVAHNLSEVNESSVSDMLKKIGIHCHGLTDDEVNILGVLSIERSPISLTTLASRCNKRRDSIEKVHEPCLIRLGFLKKNSRGRSITDAGREFIKSLEENKAK